MREQLPNFIDTQRPEARAHYAGEIAPDRIKRLLDPFAVTQATAVRIDVEPEGDGRIRLAGHWQTRLRAVCQRCLKEMEFDLEKAIDAIIVTSADAESEEWQDGDTDLEFVTPDADGRLDIVAFIEDEMILACPMIPMHHREDCEVKLDDEAATNERRKPFADLSRMMAEARNKDD